jgi:adenosylmethionine-8-amino-7-oxononanoate aminotransferase
MKVLSSNVFHRQFKRPLPFAVKAEGTWIEDADGNRYLDASGGPLVVNVGHGREEIARAIYNQIKGVDYVHPTMFTSGPVEELARRLTRKAPPGIERFYFMGSGSEAVETAVKLARQIHLAHGRPERFRLISRWGSYHGLTLGALSATGKPAFRAPFAPMLSDVVHIPAPYCYRCAFGLHLPDCGHRCADALEVALQQSGPETVSAFMAETVSGATIAAVPPPLGYFRKIGEICDRYGILLILDEVLCGLGRTGRWFASEHYDVVPDIVTLGKGLGGGAVALSAIGVRADHFDAVRKSGGFVHGGTFSHHPPAASVGNAVMEILETEKLVERVAENGPPFLEKIRQRIGSHPHVGDVRGIGYLWGIEIVKDRSTREPFPRSEQIAEKLWLDLFNRGVIVYTATGFALPGGDALVIGPPFIVTDAEMDRIVDALAVSLTVVPGD